MTYKQNEIRGQRPSYEINFILPCPANIASGGFKVVFEYANRFAEDGFNVNVFYPLTIDGFTNQKLRNRLRIIKSWLSLFPKKWKCNHWFNLNPHVKQHLVFSLNDKSIRTHTGIFVATAVETAIKLKQYALPAYRTAYLIQGFENWNLNDAQVYETYNYGFKNIVISDWLSKLVSQSGATCLTIKNGFDFNYFRNSVPIDKRDNFTISMLYHTSPLKGCKYGFEALTIVRKKYPQLKVKLFGTSVPPKGLPDWFEYFQMPDKFTLNMIYNNSAIYLAPSLSEGWGLTVGEAMICGATVLCTDTLGFKEMVQNGYNGVMVRVSDANALADAMLNLIQHSAKRIELATNALISIKEFKWDESYKRLKSALFS